MRFDLVVIGLGSAGAAAARFAATDLGLRVAGVEREQVGGDRVWSGCVPSKTLVASARVAHTVRTAARSGIEASPPEIDTAAVWRHVRAVRDEVAGRTTADTLRDLGVDVVTGTAQVTGAGAVTVSAGTDRRVLETRYVLICTGSRPTLPDVPGLADVDVLTTERLFELRQPPASMILIGGGPIGAELAQSFARLGIGTTVFEREPRLLPRDEPELAERLTRLLREEGVEVHLGRAVNEARRTADGVHVASADAEARAEAVLVAAGRSADVDQLGLERFGIVTGPHGIEVDGRNRTIVPSIYAVGDAATGRPRFTHAAVHDAVAAVRDMFLPVRRLPAPLVPWCTFTDPELAHVGLTAAEARESYGARAVNVHRAELAAVDRASTEGRTAGSVIVVTAKRRIVGAHALAPSAGEFVHEAALAIRFGIGLDGIGSLVHISPTYASALGRLGADEANRVSRRQRTFARITRRLG